MKKENNPTKLSNNKSLVSIIFTAFFVVLAAGTPPASFAHGNDYNFNLTIFGDSLSDTGNAAALGAGITFRPFENLVPDGPYFSLRFTNGRTWIERVAKALNTNDSAKAAFLFSDVGRNYAVGGARARDFPERVNLPQHVGLFLSSPNNTLGHKDGVVIQFGGNDVRDAIEAANFDPSAPTQILCEAVSSIEQNILTLYNIAQARNFLVVNAPDLGITPGITSLENLFPGISDLGTQLSFVFNSLLVSGIFQDLPICVQYSIFIEGLDKLEDRLPGINIEIFDVFALLNKVTDDPKAYRLSNGEDACITTDVFIGAICRRPGPRKFVFWDGIHPTAAMHRIVAREALKLNGGTLSVANSDEEDEGEDKPHFLRRVRH